MGSSFNTKLPRGARCSYCGAIATTRDHIVPRSKGGRSTRENMAPACEPCNGVKGDHPAHRFRGWLRSTRGIKWMSVPARMRSISEGIALFARHRGVKPRPTPERPKPPDSMHIEKWPKGRDDYEGEDR